MKEIQNIRRDHILKAIDRVDKDMVPRGRNYRAWALWCNNNKYPCKLMVSWAHEDLTGKEIDTKDPSFTTNIARACLEDLGFEIIRVGREN